MDKKDRFYYNGREWLPSGTTVIGLLDKPELVKWASNCAVDYIWENRDYLHVRGNTELVLKDAHTAFERESEQAADYGTYIHTLCEYSLRRGLLVELPHICPKCRKNFYGKPPIGCCYEINDAGVKVAKELLKPHEMTNDFTKGFWQWAQKHKVKPIAMEQEVIGQGYGGRLDLVAEVDGIITLVDYKTGKGSYYDNWKYQLAGYRAAYRHALGVRSRESIQGHEDEDVLRRITWCADHEIQAHGILKFNKEKTKTKGYSVNWKTFDEYSTTKTKADGKFVNGKLEAEKYTRTWQMDLQVFETLVKLWWHKKRGELWT